MKKSLLMLGAAVAALASCTNEEVLNVAQNKAISFESFVGKSTKAIGDIDENHPLSAFYVFGGYGEDKNKVNLTNVFNNTEVDGNGTAETTEYWNNQYYQFVGYSNGNQKLENATIKDGVLYIPTYTVGEKDLIASNVEDHGTKKGTVNMTLKHLLAKVKFTFTSTIAVGYEVEISNLQFEADKDGAYTGAIGDAIGQWDMGTSSTDKTYSFSITNPVKINATENETAVSDEFYVIPQNPSLTITFTGILKDDNGTEITRKDFTSTMSATWISNNAYNYTAELTQEKFDLDNSNIIKFEPVVKPWENETISPVTPDFQ